MTNTMTGCGGMGEIAGPCSHDIRPPWACSDCDAEALQHLSDAAPALFDAGQRVLAWWDKKLANELSSNRDFPWAEDAEWAEFHALRSALAKARAS